MPSSRARAPRPGSRTPRTAPGLPRRTRRASGPNASSDLPAKGHVYSVLYAVHGMSQAAASAIRGGRLSRDRILDAALALVGREGHEALSMRRLAQELDVWPM